MSSHQLNNSISQNKSREPSAPCLGKPKSNCSHFHRFGGNMSPKFTSITLMSPLRIYLRFIYTPYDDLAPFSRNTQRGRQRQYTQGCRNRPHLEYNGPKGCNSLVECLHSLQAVLTLGKTNSKLRPLDENKAILFSILLPLDEAIGPLRWRVTQNGQSN